MRHTNHHLRSAPIAIAAILALGSTPLVAQTAPAATAPTATPPATSPPDPIVLQFPIAPPPAEPSPAPTIPATATPAPPPSIVLDLPPASTAEAQPEAAEPAAVTRPTPAAATAASQPEPAPQRSEPAPRTDTAASDPAPVAAPAVASTAGSATAGPDTPVSSVAKLAPPIDEAIAPLPSTEAAPVAPAVEPVPDTGPGWVALIALALAGLIPLGVIFLAFAWFRRRVHPVSPVDVESRTLNREAEPVVESEPVEVEPEPVPAPEIEPEPEAEREPTAEHDPAPARDAPVRDNPLDSYRGLPSGGAAVTLPADVPETFEERDALLKRMIAAEPDRANPFRSTKARAKRARLILQSLGRNFENGKPRFDLSEYAANWPALARKRTAYA